jgi:DNA polymerase I-like protein with 3'-5' exonuclease and polymerase domains
LLINADVSGLEVVVAAELSQDKVLCQEVRERQNIHLNNQTAFGLPSRLIAKIFKFRLIYGGSAYSYANDSDFMAVSADQKYWQNVIDEYYKKYSGIKLWHDQIIRDAQKDGRLTIPSGRFFPIVPDYTKRDPWPLTVIKNYPVQGFGADLVMLARLEARKKLIEADIEALLISTIHDSIVADCPKKNAEQVGKILFESIKAVPALCKQVFGYEFSLPLTSEVQWGMNKKEMVDMDWKSW